MNDFVFILGLGFLFNYFIIYRYEKLVGSIFFMILGGMMIYQRNLVASVDQSVFIVVGLLVIIGSVINLVRYLID